MQNGIGHNSKIICRNTRDPVKYARSGNPTKAANIFHWMLLPFHNSLFTISNICSDFVDALSSPIQFLSAAEKRAKQLQNLGIEETDISDVPAAIGRQVLDPVSPNSPVGPPPTASTSPLSQAALPAEKPKGNFRCMPVLKFSVLTRYTMSRFLVALNNFFGLQGI